MAHSILTSRIISTPNKGSRNGAKVDHIILHHFASKGFAGVLDMWARAKRAASCNYAVSNEGELVSVVPEELRSWSVANAAWDSRSITFEIENERTGDASGWPVSAAAHEKVAMAVADIARRYGIPIDREHIIGHREVYTRHRAGYATACPGGLNLDGIVRRAAELAGGAAPVVAPTITLPVPGDPGANKGIQKMLKALHGYTGNIDDDFGKGSWSAMQRFLRAWGYTGPIDGVASRGGPTWRAVQRWLAARYGYRADIDGIPGNGTLTAWAAANSANYAAF